MLMFFEICFYTGIILSVILFIGNILGFIDIGIGSDFDMDIDLDGIPDVGIEGDLFPDSISPFKLVVIVPMITAFGGLGLIFLGNGTPIPLATIIAMILSFALGAFIFKCILMPLHNAQKRGKLPTTKDAIGLEGTVIIDIDPDRLGAIRYIMSGHIYNASAKSLSKETIQSNSVVIIKEIHDGIMVVEKKI